LLIKCKKKEKEKRKEKREGEGKGKEREKEKKMRGDPIIFATVRDRDENGVACER